MFVFPIMSLTLKLRNKLEIFLISLKYGSSGKTIARKYNFQNLIGEKETKKLAKEFYREEPEILKIVKKKMKETRPPWFVRNITLSSFSSNKSYRETYSKNCVYDMVTGTLLYLAGDLKDDFVDIYLENFISFDENFESIFEILREEKNLVSLASSYPDAFLLAKASNFLHEKGVERLKKRSERAFNEYLKKKRERLDLLEAKDFFYNFCLRKGRIEEVRKNLTSTEKILETQKKLGEIGATWARVSHILTNGEEKILDALESFYLNATSALNLAADDLKEIKDDFSFDKKSKVGIKNPANALALKMISENYDFLSLKELKNYLRNNSYVIPEMFEVYFKNLFLDYEKIKSSVYAEDLPHVLGLISNIITKEVKKFGKKFGINLNTFLYDLSTH
jgi:hypothetical protein